MFCIHSKPIEKQSNCMAPVGVESRLASHLAPHNPVDVSLLHYKNMENNNNLRDFNRKNPLTLESLEDDEETEQEQQLQPHDWLLHPVSDLDTLPNYLDTGISHPFQFESTYPNISFGSEPPREASAAMIMPHTTRVSDIGYNDSDTQRKLDAKAGIAVQYPMSPNHGHARMSFPAHSFDEDPTGMHNMDSHPTRSDFIVPDTRPVMESTHASREDISYLAANPASFSDSMAEHSRPLYDSDYMARSSSPFRGPRYHRSHHHHHHESDADADHRYQRNYTQVGVSHPMNRFGEGHHLLYAAHRRQYSASMFYYHHPYQEESSWDRKPSAIPLNDPRTAAPESQPDFELPATGGSHVASRPLAYTDTAPGVTGESSSRAKASPAGSLRKSTRTKKRPTTKASPEEPRSRVARSAKKAPPTSPPRSGTDGTSSGGNTSDAPSPDTSQLFHSDMTTRSHNAMKTWCERLRELDEYMKQHGHANVPQKYPENPSLGIWVNKQRMEMKFREQGKKSSMTASKIRTLQEAGFVWAKRKGEAAWEEKYRELAEFKRQNGHCNVPTKHSSNRALGRWVSTQRSQYKKHHRGIPCHLTEDRIDKLDELDFIWRMAPAKNENTDTMILHPDNSFIEEDRDEQEGNAPPEDDDDEEDSELTRNTPPSSGSSPE